MTSALHIPEANLVGQGWYTGFNRIDIFSPKLVAFNSDGDTTGTLQIANEQYLSLWLGVNDELYTANKALEVHFDLGKRNNGCNVQLSAQVWPKRGGLDTYNIPLSDFAVTDNCGLAGVNAVSLGDGVRQLPNPNGGAAAEAAYRAKLDEPAMAAARASAMTLLKSSGIVRTRFWLTDLNTQVKNADGIYASDITFFGPITLQ